MFAVTFIKKLNYFVNSSATCKFHFSCILSSSVSTSRDKRTLSIRRKIWLVYNFVKKCRLIK